MSEVRFDGKVAVVTGAGGGLGRAHSLLLASRGARVVVNDLGGTVKGAGSDQSAAQAVVDEIVTAGGEAVASFDSVDTPEGGQAIIAKALEAFGAIDIVVNNAGILRDVSFHKMTNDDWTAVMRVHLDGTFHVSHAAWPHMRERGYGRIVNTTSAAGLYGNFGQGNYAAAKLGIVGLTKALAQEGSKKNVFVNCIAPVAASRMTETILDAATLERLDPNRVSPVVGLLCAEECPCTGEVFAVGGGYVSRVAVLEAAGHVFAPDELTPEGLRDAWSSVTSMAEARPFGSAMEAVQVALKRSSG